MKQTELLASIFESYFSFKNEELKGRYITYEHIIPQINKLPPLFKVREIGRSVLKNPVPLVTFGNGPIRILAWSQMHGNETTTTKALFDLFNLFGKHQTGFGISKILESCTIKVIPMLNPDGAARYTRENLNMVDLNRDARELGEPESRILRECVEDFKPHYCLNLHDQRTIFNVGETRKPATLSFLAPAFDHERNVNKEREKAMAIIVAINNSLQKFLPGQIGRFDDSFNINCTGDSFQTMGIPTILFEAGHFPDDYQREETRMYMAMAIFLAFSNISSGYYSKYTVEEYFSIPENKKKFVDVLLKNARIKGEGAEVAIQFQEKIGSGGAIYFEPVIREIGSDLDLFGHREINCEGREVLLDSGKIPSENDIVGDILLNGDTVSIKME